ncbi:hypothetical protein QUA56_26440 [Microcoleus sp. N3A4]
MFDVMRSHHNCQVLQDLIPLALTIMKAWAIGQMQNCFPHAQYS